MNVLVSCLDIYVLVNVCWKKCLDVLTSSRLIEAHLSWGMHWIACHQNKKQWKSVKNMQHRLEGLCNKLSASDDSGATVSLSLEQFLGAVGHHTCLLLTLMTSMVHYWQRWPSILWTFFPTLLDIVFMGLYLVMVCDKSAAGFRHFCDLLTTENDVISEKET